MTRYFTHYWSNATWEDHAESLHGQPLEHTAGNLFDEHGVVPSDFVYVVTVIDGNLFLGGRMRVGRFTDQIEAEKHFGEPVWEASDHLIAAPGSATRMDFGRQVPMELVRRLQFVRGRTHGSVRFKPGDRIDRQTMRGVRELTPESATLLDGVLER